MRNPRPKKDGPRKRLLVPVVLAVTTVAALAVGASGCGDDTPTPVDAAPDVPII